MARVNGLFPSRCYEYHLYMPTSNVAFDYWINNVKKGSVSYDDDDDEVGLTGDVISDSSGRLEFVFQKMDGMLPTMYVVFSSIYVTVSLRYCI